MMSVMSSVGSPTEVSTMTMVTRPDWGIPAAPMLAAVAVMLQKNPSVFARQSKLLWQGRVGEDVAFAAVLPLMLSPSPACAR